MSKDLTKNRIRAFFLILVMLTSLIPLEASAAPSEAVPDMMWVAPSETNGIPAQIDLFKSGTSTYGGYSIYTCQLYLPGNAELSECFLSWAGDLQAVTDGITYDSGTCPIPPVNSKQQYIFKEADKTLAVFNIMTYQGSDTVNPIFIDIDESQGSIEQMDESPDHSISCVGKICIDGIWQEMPKIKGRGNYTWTVAKDKRSYNITLKNKITISGIDEAPTKKWSIISEVADHSLLCNRAGYFLAHRIGVGQDTASADVWMNGEYQGCYTLTPKYDSYVTKDGYLIENDNYKETASVEEGGDPQFSLIGMIEAPEEYDSKYNLFTVKKIGDNLLMRGGEVDESPENLISVSDNIKFWMQDAWDAIRSETGYNEKGKHYTDYIDIESFAKTYLLQEYVKNHDICAGSIFFHRDGTGEEDKLIAGPLWDLDNGMGSVYQNKKLGQADDRIKGDRRSGAGDFILNITEYKTSIYKTLTKHEDFMKEVYRQYNQHRSAFDNLPVDVEKMISDISSSAMMNHIKVEDIRDYNLHKYSTRTILEQGTPYEQIMVPTPDSLSDWDKYAANLETYLKARSLWFKDTYYDESYDPPPGDGDNTGNNDTPGNTDDPGITVDPGNTDQTDPSEDSSGRVTKAANPLKVRARTTVVKHSRLKKRLQHVAVSRLIRFTVKGKGRISYKLISVKKGTKNYKKHFKISRSTGRITIRKGTRRGIYRVKIKITASGTDAFKAGSRTVTAKIRISARR